MFPFLLALYLTALVTSNTALFVVTLALQIGLSVAGIFADRAIDRRAIETRARVQAKAEEMLRRGIL